MDPSRLLSTLTELLSTNGGIKSTNEVLRFCDLLNKFSKKLVSKIIYLKILGSSSLDILVKLVEKNGLNLLCDWLQVGVENRNWSLCQEIICVLKFCPVRQSLTHHPGVQSLIKVMNDIISDVTADKSVQISAAKVSKLWREPIYNTVPVDQQDLLCVSNICSVSSSASLFRTPDKQGVTSTVNYQISVNKETFTLSPVRTSGNSSEIPENNSEIVTIDHEDSYQANLEQTRVDHKNKVETASSQNYTPVSGTKPTSFAMDAKQDIKERSNRATISQNMTVKTKVKSLVRSRKRNLSSSDVDTNCRPKRYKQRIDAIEKLCFVIFADECYVSIIEDIKKKNKASPTMKTNLKSAKPLIADITTTEKFSSEDSRENGQRFTSSLGVSKLSDVWNCEAEATCKELKPVSILDGDNVETKCVDEREESTSNGNVSVASEDDIKIDIGDKLQLVKQSNLSQRNYNGKYLGKSKVCQKPFKKERVKMSFRKSEIKNELNQNDRERIKLKAEQMRNEMLMSNSTSKTVLQKDESSVKIRGMEESSIYKEGTRNIEDIFIHNNCLSVDIENIDDNTDYSRYKKIMNTYVIPKVNTNTVEVKETIIEIRNVNVTPAIVEEKEIAKNMIYAGCSEKVIDIPVAPSNINNCKVEDVQNDDLKNNNIVSIDSKEMLGDSVLYTEITMGVSKAISKDKTYDKYVKRKLKVRPDLKFKSKSRLVPLLRDSSCFSSSIDACFGVTKKSNNMKANVGNNHKDVQTESVDIPIGHVLKDVVKENVVLEETEERKVVGNLVIKHGAGKKEKLRVNWMADCELVKIRLFDIDVSERTNVARTKFEELRRTEIGKEKLSVGRRWPSLTLLNQTHYKKTEVDVGKNSTERQSQAKREAATLPFLGYSISPSEVNQDFVSSMYESIVKLIPLEDTTGHGTVKDYSWSELKCNILSNSSGKVRSGLNEGIQSRPIPIFLDKAKKAPCKFWATVSGCRWGIKCKFLH